ncbi:hypothetical protein AAG570_000641 [Ranatra chinensis]|uniref:Uncharacterized protein n=1 Tax=Ranatra chinensis TaxID=642074 RepID=A0ABD0YXM4_9HEMI
MASKRRNMFYESKKQDTTEIGTCNLPAFCDCVSCRPSDITTAGATESLPSPSPSQKPPPELPELPPQPPPQFPPQPPQPLPVHPARPPVCLEFYTWQLEPVRICGPPTAPAPTPPYYPTAGPYMIPPRPQAPTSRSQVGEYIPGELQPTHYYHGRYPALQSAAEHRSEEAQALYAYNQLTPQDSYGAARSAFGLPLLPPHRHIMFHHRILGGWMPRDAHPVPYSSQRSAPYYPAYSPQEGTWNTDQVCFNKRYIRSRPPTT